MRPEDRKLLEGKAPAANDNDDQKAATRSAEEKAELRRQRNRRHLWILDGELLRAIEVITGLNNSHYTELLSRDIQLGQNLVVGIQPRN